MVGFCFFHQPIDRLLFFVENPNVIAQLGNRRLQKTKPIVMFGNSSRDDRESHFAKGSLAVALQVNLQSRHIVTSEVTYGVLEIDQYFTTL